MSTNEITPSDIAAWYRQQIKKYQRLLAMHEAEFPPVAAVKDSATNPTLEALSLLNLGAVDAIKIKKYISHRGARATDLAKVFNVRVEVIKDIINDPDNGLTDKDRGWVKLVEDV